MAITDLIDIPPLINGHLTNARQATMLALLGTPRGSYDQECRSVTNPDLAALMVYQTVGPLKVRGLAPAVASLRIVLEAIAAREPDVYAGLGHAGMLCVRHVRGSSTSISNHSWGTAIDLTLNGVLDRRGDGLVQEGLTRIAPIFNEHGWYWGAGFRTEDAMHFECSDDLIRQWHADGRLGAGRAAPLVVLSLGDRGPEVRRLQARLNRLGAELVEDGEFGRATCAAVMAFQAAEGLAVDGVVGLQTLATLGLA